MVLSEFFFPKEKIITLDLGARYIKAAKFTILGKTPVMTHFEMVRTPSSAMEKSAIVNPSLLHDPLQEILFKRLKCTSHNKIYISIPGTIISTKIINAPESEEEVMKEYIRYEAGQYLPYNLDEANYDYIEIVPSTAPDMKSFFFVATNKKRIGIYSSFMSEIKANIHAMDTDFFSLKRVFSRNKYKGISKDDYVLLLDIGFQSVGFHIIRGGQLIFSRNLLTGLYVYLNEIQNNLGVSIHEARSLLGTACKGQDVPDDVMNVIQNYHPTFCREIAMGVEYFFNYFPNEKINECFVCGGGVYLPELKDELERRMEVKIHNLDVLKKIQTKGFSKAQLRKIQPFAGICVGLALRDYDK